MSVGQENIARYCGKTSKQASKQTNKLESNLPWTTLCPLSRHFLRQLLIRRPHILITRFKCEWHVGIEHNGLRSHSSHHFHHVFLGIAAVMVVVVVIVVMVTTIIVVIVMMMVMVMVMSMAVIVIATAVMVMVVMAVTHVCVLFLFWSQNFF